MLVCVFRRVFLFDFDFKWRFIVNLAESAEGVFFIVVVVIVLGAIVLFSIGPDTSYRDHNPDATVVCRGTGANSTMRVVVHAQGGREVC